MGFREGVLVAWKICMLFLRYYLSNNLREIYLKNYLQDMMMDCFCGMVDRCQAFSLISNWNHCQRSSSLQISGIPLAGFKPEIRLSWMKMYSIYNLYTMAPWHVEEGCLNYIITKWQSYIHSTVKSFLQLHVY